MRRRRLILLFLFSSVLILSFHSSPSRIVSSPPSTRSILKTMFDSIQNTKTIRYNLSATERVKGKLLSAESQIKLNVNPFKVYLKSVNRNIDVLFVHGENKGNAAVKAKAFPLPLNLDPFGNIMRNNQHHTIFQLGFSHIGGMIASCIVKTPKEKFEQCFQYKGKVDFNGRECFSIEVVFDDFKYEPLEIKENTTVLALSQKYVIGEYQIREINNMPHHAKNIDKGKTILFPNYYASKTTLYVDAKTFLPVLVRAYDDKGLYEEYSFSNVVVNSKIQDEEFSKSYSDYKF